MIEIPVVDAPDQEFGIILNGQRCTIRLRYNQTVNRWAFDLSLDDRPILQGRRIVLDRNLLAELGFGLGYLFAGADDPNAVPGRTELPSGIVRLYYLTDADRAAV